jgi:hypothetical protein
VTPLPPLIPFAALDGSWDTFIDGLYGLYVDRIVRGDLVFRKQPVRCQARPETFGKHFAFWHMMQEGKIEDDRTIDPDRCRRLLWISWVIQNADDANAGIRVFRQRDRGGNTSWALWLHEHDYVVILHERNGYFLLRTAFVVKPHKASELQRDWDESETAKN